MWTIIEVEHIRAAFATPAQLAPSSGNDDSNTCAGSCLQDQVRHTPGVINDYTAKPDV